MRLLTALLALVAYREAFWFSAEKARELDAVDVERWFFIPDETAPVIVFVMASWLLYRRLPRLRALAWERGAFWQWGPVLAAGIGVFAWSTYTGAPDLLAASLCLNAFGLAALLGGGAAVRVIWAPALFLLFAIPLPAPLLTNVVWSFQIWTADYAGWLLFLLGIPAFVSGDQILLPQQAFQVIETCSGLRSVETLSMLTVLMIDLFGRRGLHGAILLGLAPLLAFALNGFRVLTLILNPHSEIAAVHNLQGVLVLLSGLTLLYLLDGLLERFLPSSVPARSARTASPPAARPMIAAAACAAALVVISFGLPRYAMPPVPQPPLTDYVTERLGDWSSTEDLRLDPRFLERIGIRQKVFRRYERDGAAPVELLVATGHHANRFRSLFSPKSALPGSGWIVEQRELVEMEPDGFAAEASVVRKGPRRLLVYHWYQETEGIWNETLRSLAALDTSPLHRSSEAVMVRLSTELKGGAELDLLRAERRLQRFYRFFRRGLRSYARARAPEAASEEEAPEVAQAS